jgi:cyclopropane fatty-acyl-phospholipid synthase-like methyltransferase
MWLWISLLLVVAALVFVLSIWIVLTLFAGVFKKNKTAPYVSSFNKELILMKEKLVLEKGKKIVDLGCGDGKALRFFAQNYGLKGVGYDINIFAILLGNILNWWFGYRGRVSLEKKDFMEVDLSSFDYIYVYLLP